jgi:hypothetical protein
MTAGSRVTASLTRGELFDLVGYKPQAEPVLAYHNSKARLRIVSAPARTSKSYSAAHDSMVEGLPPMERVGNGKWLPKETRLNWIVGIDYSTTKEFDYLWQHLIDGKLRELFTVESARKNPDQGQMRIVLNLGRNSEGIICRAVWEVKSANHERSLQGEEIHDCILSESAEHPPKVWDRYLATRVKRATWPTTPKQSARWIYEQIQAGDRDPSLSIEHFTFPPEANPNYDWERYEIESKKAASRSTTGQAEDDPWFAEQFLGRWVFYEGRVLPFFEEPSNARSWHHVLEDELPAWCEAGFWGWSFDHGYNDPYAGLLHCIGMDGTLVTVDEFYERQLPDPDVIERVEEVNARHGVVPDLYVGDPKRPQLARHLRDLGLQVHTSSPNQVAKRAPGFRLLINMMSEDPSIGRPRWYVHRRCQNLIRELRHIRYKEGIRDEYAETSMLGDDHAISALRYGAVVLHRQRPRAETHDDWWREQAWRTRKRRAMERRAPRMMTCLE